MRPFSSYSVVSVPQANSNIYGYPCAQDLPPPDEGNRQVTYNFTIGNGGLLAQDNNIFQIDLTPFSNANQLKLIRSVTCDIICDSVGDGPSLWYVDFPTIGDCLMLGARLGTVGSAQPEVRSAARDIIAATTGFFANLTCEYNSGGSAGIFRVQMSFASYPRGQFGVVGVK